MSMLPANAHRVLFARADAIDAERYRWLREHMAYNIICDFKVPMGVSKPCLPVGRENWPTGLDAAMDKVLKA